MIFEAFWSEEKVGNYTIMASNRVQYSWLQLPVVYSILNE